jgi:acetylornithine deacetylase/succinyl-diaminopimelate desuccinylase-like protein
MRTPAPKTAALLTLLAAGAALVMLLAACVAHAPATHAAPQGLEPLFAAVDWSKAGDETVQLLSDYLKVDTFNPPGNETRGAQFIAKKLEAEGIASTLVEFAPGRSNLTARLEGRVHDKPLCLLSHTDVVTAEAEKWSHAPLSGDIAPMPDGGTEPYLWGRGALDMKGLGALEVMTMVLLKRNQVPLERDVVLMAVGDEEVNDDGMQYAIEHDWPGCAQMVNEGGIGIKDLLFKGQTVFAVSVAEKGVLWVRLHARGEAGHGSTPMPGRAPMELLQGATALMQRESEPRIHPSLYELLRTIGAQEGGFNGFVLQRPALVDLFVTGKLMAKPTTRAGITDTCQVTGWGGVGSAPNVIPSEAWAVLDCRVLPGTEPKTLLKELQDRIAGVPGVSLEVIEEKSANESPMDDPFFSALMRNVVRGVPDAVAGPVLSPGYTDSMAARRKGTNAYGMVPFAVTQEEVGTMHGRDERVSVANVKRGVEVLYRAVVETAAEHPAAQ